MMVPSALLCVIDTGYSRSKLYASHKASRTCTIFEVGLPTSLSDNGILRLESRARKRRLVPGLVGSSIESLSSGCCLTHPLSSLVKRAFESTDTTEVT